MFHNLGTLLYQISPRALAIKFILIDTYYPLVMSFITKASITIYMWTALKFKSLSPYSLQDPDQYVKLSSR